MLWFHLFTEIKQQRNNLFLWSPMAFAYGIAATFVHGQLDWSCAVHLPPDLRSGIFRLLWG
jgi:hypothetical protein